MYSRGKSVRDRPINATRRGCIEYRTAVIYYNYKIQLQNTITKYRYKIQNGKARQTATGRDYLEHNAAPAVASALYLPLCSQELFVKDTGIFSFT